LSLAAFNHHASSVELHWAKSIQSKRILIMGGGLAGIEFLRQLKKADQNEVSKYEYHTRELK